MGSQKVIVIYEENRKKFGLKGSLRFIQESAGKKIYEVEGKRLGIWWYDPAERQPYWCGLSATGEHDKENESSFREGMGTISQVCNCGGQYGESACYANPSLAKEPEKVRCRA